VGEALARFAELTEVPVDEVTQQSLPGIEQAMLYGLLELPDA